MFGSRTPPGGVEELMRLGHEDAVLNLNGPVGTQAAEEFEPAWADLRSQLDLGDGPIGVLGESMGAAVALLVLAESRLDISAAVLVSPLVRLRPTVDALGRRIGVTYPWSERSLEVARRLDFVARADDIARRGDLAVLLVVGVDDDRDGFHEPAAELRSVLAGRYADPRRCELVLVPEMAHALADEPGVEPAPQTPAAAEVDRHASRWLRRHLRP